MPVRPDQLAILVEGKTGLPVGPVPLPRPSDVLYCPPNADGTRKKCGNCALWAESDEKCLLMGTEVSVTGDMVCGYHVNGEPQLYVSTLGGKAMVTPELAGLIRTNDGAGTSCDMCQYYDPRTDKDGLCKAVYDQGKPAKVQPLGCCARWVREV